MANAHHKLLFFLPSLTVSLLEEWEGGGLHCGLPIQGLVICTKLTLPGEIFTNSLPDDPVTKAILKKKQASHGKHNPAGLKQEEKVKLCLKSGPFDPWTHSPLPAGFLKALMTEEWLPLQCMNASRWRLVFKMLVHDYAITRKPREILLWCIRKFSYDYGQWLNDSCPNYSVLWNRMTLVGIFGQLRLIESKRRANLQTHICVHEDTCTPTHTHTT